jgi:hypothetical protein
VDDGRPKTDDRRRRYMAGRPGHLSFGGTGQVPGPVDAGLIPNLALGNQRKL